MAKDAAQIGNPCLPSGSLLAALAIAAVACLATAYLVVLGEHARADARREAAAEIAREDAQFCTKFGVGPATNAFVRCSEALSTIRRHQEQRSADAADLP